jgi:hypothetical protein
MKVRLTVCVALALVGLMLWAAVGVGEVPAKVRTTTAILGDVVLEGLEKTSRLLAEIPPHIGPARVFDIPISAIQQITIDFPRVIVETVERVFIGPWSMFTGLPETLSYTKAFGVIEEIYTTAVRAIALNGHAFREVPREWLGDGYLTQPKVIEKIVPIAGAVGSTPAVTAPLPDASLALPSETPIDDLFPTYPVETDTQQELPWWVVLVGVGVLAVIALLSVGGTSSP